MKTRTKIFHILATIFSVLITMHVFMSIANAAPFWYVLSYGFSLWYMGKFGNVKIGTVKDLFTNREPQPETNPETPKAIPWIESKFDSFDFWANLPWVNFVTQDKDGNVYGWITEPNPVPDAFFGPQWINQGEEGEIFDLLIDLHGNYNIENWQTHIARRGEMPVWLLEALQQIEP